MEIPKEVKDHIRDCQKCYLGNSLDDYYLCAEGARISQKERRERLLELVENES